MNISLWFLAFVNMLRKAFFNYSLTIPGLEHPSLMPKERILEWVLVILFVLLLVWLVVSYS